MENSVRLGVIGVGNIAQQHIEHVINGLVKRCVITAVCSRTRKDISGIGDAKYFNDYRAMIDSGECDAVLIATPTMQHREMGAYALKTGLHVLMEKPIGLSVADGEYLLSLVGENQVFGLMLNQRLDPVFQRMKKIIDQGELGKLQRTSWTMTHWFRPNVYFKVSDWRATWRGEGGGLLVNQCIHNLDVFQWLCGMPEKVVGFCGFGKYHPIEVEDEATAYFNYANGATGLFVGSTGEAPGVNQLDIVGDGGTLSYDGKTLTFKKNTQSTSQYCSDSKEMFGMPNILETDITLDDSVNQHAEIIENFVCAVLDGMALIAPAEEGIPSLALANAIVLSAWKGEPVSLPLDSRRYQEELDKRIECSMLREKENIDTVIDMKQSYR